MGGRQNHFPVDFNARLEQVEIDLTEHASRLDDETPLRRAHENDVRWMKVQMLDLERALNDSLAQSAALAKSLDVCFDLIESQDDRLSEQHKALRAEVDALTGRCSQTDRELFELRSKQTAASERFDSLAAELLELTHRSERLGVNARTTAELSASQSERVAEDLRHAFEEAKSLAAKARRRAKRTARQAETVADELRADNRAAVLLAAETAEEAEKIAEELRQATLEARLIAEDALAQSEQHADASSQIFEELRDAAEEARVLAEKAKDAADFTSDTVSGLQVDLDQRSAELDGELSTQAETLREVLDDTARKSELDESRRDLGQASERLTTLESLARSTQGDGARVAMLRKEIRRELEELRSMLEQQRTAPDAEPAPRKKRWMHHLQEQPPSAPELEAAPQDRDRWKRAKRS